MHAYFNDKDLKRKCAASKAAWKRWNFEGRPKSGSSFLNLKQAKYEVKRQLQRCKAREARKHIQSRDNIFKKSHPGRFWVRIPRKRPSCNKLLVNGCSYTDNTDLLWCWHDHFQALSKSKSSASNCSGILSGDLLLSSSKANDDQVLNYDISIEEVEGVIKSLKNGKSPGPDGISSEHLKYGGPAICVWLKRIFNVIINAS